MCDWRCHDPTGTVRCAALKSLLCTEVCDAEHTYNAAVTSVHLRRKKGVGWERVSLFCFGRIFRFTLTCSVQMMAAAVF